MITTTSPDGCGHRVSLRVASPALAVRARSMGQTVVVALALVALALVALAPLPAAAQVTVDADTTWSTDQNVSGTLTVAAGVTVTVSGTVMVTADAFVLEPGALITANGSGHGSGAGPTPGAQHAQGGGGGGHGGRGANGNGAGGESHGFSKNPSTMGSGGGAGCNGAAVGGAGGGAVRFVVVGQCTVEGMITANGANGGTNGGCGSTGGGGGAGGTIFLQCGAVDGGGSLHANGGNGGQGVTYPGGGGAGGRVLVRASALDLDDPGQSTVTAGVGSSHTANPGTLGLYDVDDDRLVVHHGWELRADEAPHAYASFAAYDADVRARGVLSALDVTGSFTHAGGRLYADGVFDLLAGGAVVIDDVDVFGAEVHLEGASLDLDPATVVRTSGRGFASNSGPAPGAQHSEGGGGAGHGGPGGRGNPSAVGGASYDLTFNPTQAGSGGGRGYNGNLAGGAGGGVIRLSATGACVLDGILESNGVTGAVGSSRGAGGGAGGAVAVACDTLTGTGRVHVNGGHGGASTYTGGGGAGGRALLRATTSADFSLATSSALGGTGYVAGSNGTVVLVVDATGALTTRDGLELQGAEAPFSFGAIALHGQVRADVDTTLTATGDVSLDGAALSTSSTFTLDATGHAVDIDASSLRASQLTLLAGSLTFSDDSVIDVSGLGYPATQGPGAGETRTDDWGGGGGGHGGAGGTGGSGIGAGGPRYDDPFAPTEPGSGGGHGRFQLAQGGAGGGVVRIDVSGEAILEGELRANGYGGGNDAGRGGGGGAGGSIWVTASTLSGRATFSARGGQGGGDPNVRPGGAGAGGRISVEHTAGAGIFDPADSTAATNTVQPGEDGTAAFRNTTTGALYVVSGLDLAAPGPHTYSRVDLHQARLQLRGADVSLVVTGDVRGDDSVLYTDDRALVTVGGALDLDGGGSAGKRLDVDVTGAFTATDALFASSYLDVDAASMHIDANTLFDGNGRGYPRREGPGTSPDPITGDRGGGGAGHGGRGGYGSVNNSSGPRGTPGPENDTAYFPAEMGSGGGDGYNGNAAGGTGGGVVRLKATGVLHLDGLVRVSGNSGANVSSRGGGGGAGGSILLEGAQVSGLAVLQANGGSGGIPGSTLDGGGGAGGRVHVRGGTVLLPRTDLWTADAGGGYEAGTRGTMFVEELGTGHLHIIDGWQAQGGSGNGSGTERYAYQSVEVDAAALVRVDSVVEALDVTGTLHDDGATWRLDGVFALSAARAELVSADWITTDELQLTGSEHVTLTSTAVRGRRIHVGGGAVSLDLTSTLDTSARGAGATTGDAPGLTAGDRGGGGAGHGGPGGIGSFNNNSGPRGSPGVAYGDAHAPTALGSGGGHGFNGGAAGGAGGGAVRIVADSLHLDGTVTANGTSGVNVSSRGGGGGSGGSIWITVDQLEGAGRMTAHGGSGGAPTSTLDGGGGAGGRILVEHTSGGLDVPELTGAQGGSGYEAGSAGTAVFHDVAGNTLVVSDAFDFGENESYASVALVPGGRARFLSGGLSTLTVAGPFTADGASLSGSGDVSIVAHSVDLDQTSVSVAGDLFLDVAGSTTVRTSTVAARRIDLAGESLEVRYDASLTTAGRGFARTEGPEAGVSDNIDGGGGGGGHGGRGGRGWNGPNTGGAEELDDPLAPVALGSGGGDGRYGNAPGGAGGGAVRIDLTGTMRHDGVVDAGGAGGGNESDRGGGGGAGGSVYVTAATVEGAGVMRARGGNGGANARAGGGGGGGRIAVIADELELPFGATDVRGGTSSYEAGLSGSAVFIDSDDQDLVIAGGMTFFADHSPFAFRSVTTLDGSGVRTVGPDVRIDVQDGFTSTGAVWAAAENLTVVGDVVELDDTTLTGRWLSFTGREVHMLGTTNVSTSGRGYAAGDGPSAGAGEPSDWGGGGAGHGGKGGNGSAGAAGGAVVGDDVEPEGFGSGGGNGWNNQAAGGAGGGRIDVVAEEVFVLDGALRASGASGANFSDRGGGGGAGGTIRIHTGQFDGDGLLQANGGNGGANSRRGGGGGGGRIRLCHLTGSIDDLLPVEVGGGSGAQNGEGGTFFVDSDCDRAPLVASLRLWRDALAVPAAGRVPAGLPVTYQVAVDDPNGAGDLSEVRVLPFGAGGPTFVWTREDGVFAQEGDTAAITLDGGASTAALGSDGFSVRFVATPAFSAPAGALTPLVQATDAAGLVASLVADEARYEVERRLRLTQVGFSSLGRPLLADDWIKGGAQLDVSGRVTHAGFTTSPPASLGIAAVVLLGPAEVARDDDLAQGQVGISLTAGAGDVSYRLALDGATLPTGAVELDPVPALPLRADGTAPQVAAVELNPPRLASSYVGGVTILVTASDGQSGVALAAHSVRTTVGSGPLGPVEALLPVGGGAFTYALADRSWAPFVGESLRYEITIRDLAGNESVVNGMVPVDAENAPPAITSTPPSSATEGSVLTYAVVASDPDGDPLTYAVLQGPAGMTIDEGGVMEWVPGYDQIGMRPVTLRVYDALGATADQAFTLAVGFLDEDGDGMPDTWERTVGLDPRTDDADGDVDGDGRTNLDEYLDGSDPVSNLAPSAPIPVSPVDEDTVDTSQPVLAVLRASDPEGDVLTYQFELYGDVALSTLVEAADELDDDGERARFVPMSPLDDDRTYFWRARAFDGLRRGPWSPIVRFSVNAGNGVPGLARTLSPLDGGTLGAGAVTLVTTPAFDPEGAVLTYRIEVLPETGTTPLAVLDPLVAQNQRVEASWSPPGDGVYRWRVRAEDPAGGVGAFSAYSTFTVDSLFSDVAPQGPVVVSPDAGEIVVEANAALTVQNAVDPEGARLTYDVELDTDPCFCSPALEVATELGEGVSGSTSYFPSSLLHAQGYVWRARARDAYQAGPFAASDFTVRRENVAPTVPVLQAPGDGGQADALGQRFRWVRSADVEDDVIAYDVQILEVSSGEAVVVSQGAAEGGDVVFAWMEPDLELEGGHVYAWRVRARDDAGGESAFSPAATFSVYAPSTANHAPDGLSLLAPTDGTLVATVTPVLTTRNAVDPDEDPLRYHFQLFGDEALLSLVFEADDVGQGAGGSTAVQVGTALEEGATYWWRAAASDGSLTTGWTPSERFTVRSVVTPPGDLPPDLIDPDPEPGVHEPDVEPDSDLPVGGCPCSGAGGSPDLALLGLMVGLLVAIGRRRAAPSRREGGC